VDARTPRVAGSARNRIDLWHVSRPDEPALRCLFSEREDGHVAIDVLRGGRAQYARTFDDVESALRFAEDMYQQLRAHGWRAV
jgi:hypothetical protein